MRQHMRRFTRQHSTPRVAPVMAADITDRLWEMSDMVALIDAANPHRKRGAEKGLHVTRSTGGRTIASIGLAVLLLVVSLLRVFGLLVPGRIRSLFLLSLCLVAGAFWGTRVVMALRSGEVSWVAGWTWNVKTFPRATAPARYWAATLYFAVLGIIFAGLGVLLALAQFAF
jgi:hypothetical protein